MSYESELPEKNCVCSFNCLQAFHTDWLHYGPVAYETQFPLKIAKVLPVNASMMGSFGVNGPLEPIRTE